MVARTKFSSSVSPDILARMRDIARADGRTLNAVLEDAITAYIENRDDNNVRPEVMAHFRDSVEKNRRLYRMLAE
ncbi:MAG: hypothetical protein OXC55_06395 [Chloroflexi bacterium]|nr:hypothetical protein [Chloroflexota bacterium]